MGRTAELKAEYWGRPLEGHPSPVRPHVRVVVAPDGEAVLLEVGAGEDLLVVRVPGALPLHHAHAALVLVVQEAAAVPTRMAGVGIGMQLMSLILR